jgi:hypothetical protein
MTTEEKTLLALLTLAAVSVPAALGAALDWPTWSWLLLAVVLLCAPGLVARNIQRRVQQEWLLQPDTAALAQVEQRDPAQQTLVADIPLPSGVAGYDFHFSATVYRRSTRGSETVIDSLPPFPWLRSLHVPKFRLPPCQVDPSRIAWIKRKHEFNPSNGRR